MNLVRTIGVTLDYWVGGEFRTSYRLRALSQAGEPSVELGQFLEPGASAALPLSTILADTGISDFVNASRKAAGFDRVLLESTGRPLRVQIRRLGNGRVRMLYEAASVVGADNLKVVQAWDPGTDEVTAEYRPAATVSFADFRGFYATLQAFYGQIKLDKATG